MGLLYAQETTPLYSYTKDYRIYFEFDKHVIKPHFRGNEATITTMLHDIDSIGLQHVDSIVVVAKASPEGVWAHNMWLAEKRTAAMRNYILQQRPDVEYLVRTESQGEAWDELRANVVADTLISEAMREKTLAVIDADVNIATKKWRLEQVPIYRYLLMTYYPPLRYSGVCVVYYKSEIPYDSVMRGSAIGHIEEPEPFEASPVPVKVERYERKELFYLRTNFLVPLHNFGAEVAIGNNWSIGADYYFPWVWRNPNHKNCFEILAWDIEGRYWFGKDREEEDRLEGHSVGAYASLGYYDFQMNYEGNQGEFIGAGVDYLYSIPICDDRLHIEFSLGIGYVYTYMRPYKVYEDGGKGYRQGYTKEVHWFGPTKATVSLVIPIKGKRRLVR